MNYRNRMIATSFLIGIICSACSTTGTMQGIMSSWEGANISEVVSQWGYPDEEREFQGKKLYIWQHNKSAYIPQTTNTMATAYGNTIYAQSQSAGDYVLHGNCVRVLEINGGGTVTSWQWKGNNCPFGELMEYSAWRRKTAK
ncbi:MAG: hypothetical protein AB7P24_05485 [Nitrospira sp.]